MVPICMQKMGCVVATYLMALVYAIFPKLAIACFSCGRRYIGRIL